MAGTKKKYIYREKDIYLEKKGMWRLGMGWAEGKAEENSQTSDRGKGVHTAVCQRERR